VRSRPVHSNMSSFPPLPNSFDEFGLSTLTISFRRSRDSGKLVFMAVSLFVACKNAEFHTDQSTFEGYRITVAEQFDIPMRIRCDNCGKWFEYDPKDIIFVMSANEGPPTINAG